MRDAAKRIASNLAGVLADIDAACQAAGRTPDQVRLIGVTKYVDAETTAMLVAAGCRDLGENRPQVLWQKCESGLIDDSVRWHMIGHLQRNKVRRLLRRPVMIQSIDSPRVAEAVAEASVAEGRSTDALLEINISGEQAKTGLSPQQAEQILRDGPIAGLRWCGLMAMAGKTSDAAKQFASLRQYRDRWQETFGLSLPELSMGMSGDFVDAIAEGSTMVRIGTRLFEGVMDDG